MLTVGETAPDFELRGTLDGEKGTYRLSEFIVEYHFHFLAGV